MRTPLLLAALTAACQAASPDLAVVTTARPIADEELLQAVALELYGGHADAYDMLVLWGGAGLEPTSSYYYPVQNDVPGLGYQHVGPAFFDDSGRFGSARLQGIIWMGPDWLANEGVGTRSVPGILLQETGHRWAASVYFQSRGDKDGASDALLANPYHWSFFLDSGPSPLGGNQWTAVGGDRFVATPVERASFSPLDLYLMGLLAAEEVAPVTLLTDLRDDAGRPSAAYTRASPRVTHDLTIRATARQVSLASIIAVEGRREPAVGFGARDLHQAWIYVGREPPGAFELERLATLQAAWPEQFREATGGRGTMSVALEDLDPAR